MSSQSLNFRLPQETKDWVASHSEEIDRTPGWLMRKLIADYRATVPQPKRSAPAKQANSRGR